MRTRPSSRLLLIDPEGRVLLFHFAYENPRGVPVRFWATPGGAVEPGETFEEAAIRELWEETGLVLTDPGRPIAERRFELELLGGERVLADERYFVVRAERQAIDSSRWTPLEVETMKGHRWWSPEDLRSTEETYFPENLCELLGQVRNR